MKQALSARFYVAKQELKIEDVGVPELGDNDVEVQIKASGVCQSDLHTINGRQTPPLLPVTLGHEASGIVTGIGKQVKNVQESDRVGIDYVWSCGKCEYCLEGKDNLCDNLKIMSSSAEGSWKEIVVTNSRHVHKLPNNIGFPEGAILNCAVMTSYHAVRYAEIRPGLSVLIYGLGGVGMSLLKWAKIAGSSDIIAVDQEEEKLRIAKREGATSTINPSSEDPVESVKKLSRGGVDIGFEIIGKTETYRNTLAAVKRGGKAVLVGMSWDPFPIHVLNDLQFREVKLMSPADHSKSEITEVLRLIETNRYQFGDAITHRFPLRFTNEAVEVLQKRIGNPGRVILEP